MVVFNVYMIHLSLVMTIGMFNKHYKIPKGQSKLNYLSLNIDYFNEPQQCIYTYLFTYAGVQHDFHM
jgi:hypothetical protein